MKLLRIILFPSILLYSAVIRIRNLFFEKKIFKSKKVDAKVISVGNITVGGSGKTPMVIFLCRLLKKTGRTVGVLSRGYGRKSSGYKLVSDGKNILASVDECGDEIYHTALNCGIPAAVSESRVKGASRLIKDTGVSIILLDDAFQHRWIERDIDLLIFEQRFLREKNVLNKRLLPTGIMREPFDAVRRADAIIINRKFSEPEKIPDELEKFFRSRKIFTAYYKAIGFVDVTKKTEHGIDEFEGQKSLVVSGIARPFSLINVLRQTKVDTENQLMFIDHKDYTLKDIQKIRKQFYITNSHSVVTTEKDAVKLSKYSKELDDIDIYYLKIELRMDNEKEFEKFITDKLNKRD
jgi:tetraacyldisaccharide 4'-kinase